MKKLRGNVIFKMLDRYAGIPLVWLLGLMLVRSRQLPPDPVSILVIKLSAIGDTILLLPALRSLRSRYPKAQITFLGTRINKDIITNCSAVDRLIILNMGELFRHPITAIGKVRSSRPDIAVDFDQWVRLTALISLISGAPFRAGFRTTGQYRHYLFNRSVCQDHTKHELDAFFDVLGLVDAGHDSRTLFFTIPVNAVREAEKVLDRLGIDRDRGYVILHPETPAHGGQRQWPLERFRELGKRLAGRAQTSVLISGTRSEESVKYALAQVIGPSALPLPPVSLTVFAALLRGARLLVCGNTGIMHLACAVNAPVLALHGPTDPRKWGPRSENAHVIAATLPCSPCLCLGFEYGCPENRCMSTISIDDVMEKAIKILRIH